MPTRTARTAWSGTLTDGSGKVELASSGTGTFDVSFPRRAAESADGVASPEEFIAAAHSSCFAMALSAELAALGGTPDQVEVTADVTLDDDPNGGHRITSSVLTVKGFAAGLDEASFRQAAEAAKIGCPVSKALGTVDEIVLEVVYEH
ncbi:MULTISPECIES: OsmC family peroxiredoxin [Isoptericola]|uniref:OsmC family peroxiredoxin n=1 Tax=Isoptericola sediminis TaxID=2733572 RepID=A0A849K1Z6_9MICO|nr:MULTISPECIES: OsmC family peroxiredoxin [Isoptericola]MDO8145545.1 OsmC family peroxiredoxin [Isoptericola sp. 178]MDO8149259.1 OsmC family peroxiredoxin [Isoptericola sp. b515]MDO8152198.1 OsmC family peroxiredoxin [Isoptericola sp. b408]NNU26089.1 OsmC family peroxiredoxin [Isoptericola sediminis]